MKKLIMAAVGACALAGGARAEHVNLWPLYYSDGGTWSIAWPLTEFTDSTDWRVWTIYREHDSWGAFPFYMNFHDSVVVTPFVVSKNLDGGAILPLAFADWSGSDTFWTIFPAVYRHAWGDGNSTTWAAAGLAGRKTRDGETVSHWLAPLWWRWPKARRGIFAAGLAGWDHERDDDKSDWCIPFYWRDKDTFWSIPWACGYDADGKITGWFSLPLLSWCKGDEVHITPIVGKTDHSNWLAPVYYWNDEGTFCTLLGGKTKDASWILPLYYRDSSTFFSLPLYYRNSEEFFTIPFARRNGTDVFMCGLAGRSRKPERMNDWMLPFWYREDGDFYSMPYGRVAEGKETTLRWWGLPLFRTISGRTEGFGVWPIFERRRDVTMDDFEAAAGAELMGDDVASGVCPWPGDGLSVSEESLEWLGGIAGIEHIVRVGRDGKSKWKIDESRELGNMLFFKRRSRRTATFDAKSGTREKVIESGSSHLLGFVWSSDWHKTDGTLDEANSSVLWLLWRSRFKGVYSTIDVFPWFSRESTKEGRSTTSFLWRFFRYENDPEKGKKVDLFFVPVWR